MDTSPQFCGSCGAPLAQGLRFCEQCGQAVGARAKVLPDTDVDTPVHEPHDGPAAALTWNYDVPLLTNRYFLWDMVRVLVLSAVLCEGLVWAISFFFTDEAVLLPPLIWAIPLGIIAVLFVLVSLLIYGNRFHGHFTLDEKAVTYEVGMRERKILRVLSVIGILFGGWRAVGPSLIAYSRQVESVKWPDVYKVSPDPTRYVIALSNSWRTVMRLYCPADRFAEILARVQACAAAGADRRSAHPKPRYHRSTGFYVSWFAATALATLATLVWPWTNYDGPDRMALLAGLLVLIAGLASAAWWGRLIALPAALVSVIVLLRIAGEALDTFNPMGGGPTEYTFTLDTPALVVTVFGGLGLLALGLLALFIRMPAATEPPRKPHQLARKGQM